MDKSSSCGILLAMLVLVAALATTAAQLKTGSCPPPTGVGICANTCSADEDCNAQMKCCRTACGGTTCSLPVTSRNVGNRKQKSGSCPTSLTGPWVCANRCSADFDCRGRLKCCRNRCGALACQKPEM